VRLADGSALLVVLDHLARQSKLICYKSASGNGGDWAHFVDVDITVEFTGSIFNDSSECHITMNPEGELFIAANVYHSWFTTNCRSAAVVFKSMNSGASWTEVLAIDGGTTAVRGTSQVAFLPDRLWVQVTRVNYTTLYESTDDGDSWTSAGNFGGTGFDSLVDPSLQGASAFYDEKTDSVLVHLTHPFGGSPGEEGGLFVLTNPTTARIDAPSNFERLSSITDLGLALSARVYSLGSTPVVHLEQDSAQRIYSFEPDVSELQGIKSISVNHKLGSASAATITLDNPAGVYSYDGAENLHKIGPNKEVTIYMGYGADQEKVFYGLIDRISEQSFPQALVISARDMGKKAMDGMITDASGYLTVTFANASPEAIFNTLAGWAGYSTVVVETSGITIESKTWNGAKFVDAFNWLCDIAGFDWTCDTDGIIYFKKRATNTPRSEAEEHALVLDEGEYKCTLEHHPILESSYTIKNVAEDTAYTKDTDYTLDLATGDLVAVAGGALASGGMIHPKYTYPRFVFQEGVTLKKLNSYSIDDKPLFYKIYAVGKDSDGAALLATWVMSSNPWNVLETKRKRVQVDGIVTQAELQKIVDAIGADMLQKARSVKCTGIGVPTVIDGDCIQNIESSSTMSEIYRVTNVTHTFNGEMATNFTCYHYGYAPIVEGGSE
jgi:hypothetical protein